MFSLCFASFVLVCVYECVCVVLIFCVRRFFLFSFLLLVLVFGLVVHVGVQTACSHRKNDSLETSEETKRKNW